jgi:hypothetical protein
MPVLPAHPVPRRLLLQHLLDHAAVRGLADALGLEDDAVTDVSVHLFLLWELFLAKAVLPCSRGGCDRSNLGSGGRRDVVTVARPTASRIERHGRELRSRERHEGPVLRGPLLVTDTA